MATSEELYAVLGELAVNFSNLEHNVLRILDAMACGDAFLGPILLDGMGIYRVIEKTRTYIKYRLREDPELSSRVTAFLNEVNEVRSDRNRFIHGLWHTEANLMSSGTITCITFKLHYDEEFDLLGYIKEHKYTLNQLKIKIGKTMILCSDAVKLGKDIKTYLDKSGVHKNV